MDVLSEHRSTSSKCNHHHNTSRKDFKTKWMNVSNFAPNSSFNSSGKALEDMTIFCVFSMTLNLHLLLAKNRLDLSRTVRVKPLSQLEHDHFKTLCDPAFGHSHDGSPTLHELSLPLHAIFRSPAVASDFWTCLKFRGDRVRLFVSHWVSRSLVRASYNVVCTRKSGARTFEVVRWFGCLDASVVQPWDCCSTCGMWSCNVVLPLYNY